MRPNGSAAELQVRRRMAARLLQEGRGIREVARIVGASPSSVFRWKQAVKRGGLKALDAKPHPGRPAKLTPRQRKKLVRLLAQGPRRHGYPTELWTLKRVAEVIENQFGVRYDPSHVWRILHRLGWSCRKPERRARERDEAAIVRWRAHDWPRIKKSSTKRP